VSARNDSAGRHRSDGVIQEAPHLKRTIPIRFDLEGRAVGPISRVVIAPVVEADAVGIGGVRGMEAELARSRIEPVHAGHARLLVGGPGRLDVGDVEDPALIVKETVRSSGV